MVPYNFWNLSFKDIFFIISLQLLFAAFLPLFGEAKQKNKYLEFVLDS